MQPGNVLLSVLAAALIVLAIVLKVVISQTYRVGIGNRYYRPDSIAWMVLMVGLVLGGIVVLTMIMRSDAV
jgi:hypothetical protein